MTLTQLEYIIAVDTHKSFVSAAEKCFVTQPTLSMQVQKLEEELGVKLFDRSRQPIKTTPTGLEIIEQARSILRESLQIREIISSHSKELSGELKIGIIPTMAPYIMPKVIRKFIKKYPKVRLVLSELTTEKIIKDVKNGLLDCGLLSTPLEEANIEERVLYYEEFVAYLSKNNVLNNKEKLTAEDIENTQLWILNEGNCLRNQVLNFCQKKKENESKLNFEYNTGSVETLRKMVDLNFGMTIIPELALEDMSSKHLDRVRHFKSPVPVREISLITHKNIVKKRLILALESAVSEIIPERMKSKRKRTVIGIN